MDRKQRNVWNEDNRFVLHQEWKTHEQRGDPARTGQLKMRTLTKKGGTDGKTEDYITFTE